MQEGLSVSKSLQVEQSFEDLEAAFEPGELFRFEAILQYQDSIWANFNVLFFLVSFDYTFWIGLQSARRVLLEGEGMTQNFLIWSFTLDHL